MNNSLNNLTLLVCGGTLDKDYDPLTGELTFSQSHLPKLLAEANHTLNITLTNVMLKDSLAMNDADRERVYQACSAAINSKIVITHGTDTMPHTAAYLAERIDQLKNKTLVITGAMRPFQLGQSDASFNLGSALMAAQLLPAGVYIAMNGQIFLANQVQKDRSRGVFVTDLHT
ncbi:asparaginase domain-containing protein [Thiomicrospira sp. ALE5]|uniref:asparaginase domain-containing protein n=1 Tax=Thiomicrospira sp. ALE5 TaxID=748650 RepID=UPI0008EF3FEE|nr:asparaginase domain-containing protein [Thiomicrospira sp. ALE5]SFR50287.1 L-asparaginase [Thiomicrospira sp. ALE5]